PRSARASSGRYGRCNRLSVLYFPFSETTPFSMRGVSLAFHTCIMYRININTKYTIRNTGEIQMAREGITFEQVAAAADSLVGQG
ncbi:hypothetical protein, partial [Enterococcus faecium]|uniref:hypothetical protein n=1 Tax=Enterococcus faecium TaxID=1352 RepID=UPI003F43D6B2